ncbi:MAG: KH domain-containing protein [Lawsonibacter sp.]|nr:KH domain-containing protein [Lawsonibacter sp.]
MTEELVSVVKQQTRLEPSHTRRPAPPRAERAERAERVEKPEKPEKAEKPAPSRQEAPAQPALAPQEETILAAKPGWQPAPSRPRAPRPESSRPERRERPARSRPAPGRLQEGDEVIIPAARPAGPIQLTPAGPEDEKAAKISAFLTGLMEHMGVEATPQVFTTSQGGYKAVLQGQNLGAIIGRRGETLDAIQQLTGCCVNRGQSKRVRVHVDAEGYRAKREESLQRLAVKMAQKAVRYRKNMMLEPMNAYERHVIHTALQDFPNVSTYSTGVEPNRRTVVAYSPGQK